MPVQEKNLLKTEQISQSIFEILENNFDLKLDKNNKNIKDQKRNMILFLVKMT